MIVHGTLCAEMFSGRPAYISIYSAAGAVCVGPRIFDRVRNVFGAVGTERIGYLIHQPLFGVAVNNTAVLQLY